MIFQPSALLNKSSTYFVMGALTLVIDLATGPFLLFPILFVIPVGMAAWHCLPRTAISLAVLLPIGRLLIALAIDQPFAPIYLLANAAIRIAVLLIISYWVFRSASQAKELRSRVEGFVIMCAWSRTVEHEGNWISFEEYLKKRFKLDVSHGISPEEATRAWDKYKSRTGE